MLELDSLCLHFRIKLSQNFTGGHDTEGGVWRMPLTEDGRLVPPLSRGRSGQERDALVLAGLGVEDVKHGTVEIV